jgi:hypothetical protein
MEKAGYGLRLIQWRPQSRAIWDLSAFYQLCSFACTEPMALDFIKKEKWRIGQMRAALKERTHS